MAPGRVPGSTAQGPIAIIRRNANEVLADFVVVDRHGRLVQGLTPSELEVTDNGVREQIESLRLVTRSVRLRPQNWHAAGLRVPATEPPASNLTALIFDPLSAMGTRRARRAAIKFVQEDLTPGNYLAVFLRRQRLVLLQPFTDNPTALDAAIRQATGHAVIQINYEREYEEYKALAAAMGHPNGPAAGTARPSATTLAAATPYWLGAEFPVVTNTYLLGAVLNQLRFVARSEGTRRTRNQLAGFRQLIALLAPFRGRKSVVLFTERLYLRNGLRFIFRAMIQQANRATISFYPVDVAGLSIRPDLAALATALRGPAYSVERGAPVEPNVGNAVNDSQTVLLGELARATGGLAVTDTNDPAGFMSRIAAASSAHYELAFTPQGFASGAAPTRHLVVIRIPRHRHWRVLGRKTYFAPFSAPPSGAK